LYGLDRIKEHRDMRHYYISLGSACDAAISLKYIGVRKESLPFDWLWNFDTGLRSVVTIIENDFKQIIDKDSYQLANHYRFSKPVVVYKSFPGIVHLHSDPMTINGEHEKMLRRIKRFINILNNKSKKHFVYYKCYEEDLIKNCNQSIKDTLDELICEGEKFVTMLLEKYAHVKNQFYLLLIIQTDKDKSRNACNEIRNANTCYPEYIKLSYTITRNNENRKLHNIGIKQWNRCLIRETHMPIIMQQIAKCHAVFRNIVRAVCFFASSLMQKSIGVKGKSEK